LAAEEEARRRAAEEEEARRAAQRKKAIEDLNDALPAFLNRAQHEKETDDMMEDFNLRAKELADWIKNRDEKMQDDLQNNHLGDTPEEVQVIQYFTCFFRKFAVNFYYFFSLSSLAPFLRINSTIFVMMLTIKRMKNWILSL